MLRDIRHEELAVGRLQHHGVQHILAALLAVVIGERVPPVAEFVIPATIPVRVLVDTGRYGCGIVERVDLVEREFILLFRIPGFDCGLREFQRWGLTS